eukprot:8594228-Lingulodinium_polyedra.AAC.1
MGGRTGRPPPPPGADWATTRRTQPPPGAAHRARRANNARAWANAEPAKTRQRPGATAAETKAPPSRRGTPLSLKTRAP